MDLLQNIYGSTTDKDINIKDCLQQAEKTANVNISEEAKNLALLVAQSGNNLEKIAKNFYDADKNYAFLSDKKGSEYQNYRKLVHQLKKDIQKSKIFEGTCVKEGFKNIIVDNDDIEQYAWQQVAKGKATSVIDKRVLKIGVEYLISWKNLDNTWVPGDTDNYVYKQLISEYEEKLKAKKSQKFKETTTQVPTRSYLSEDQEIIIGAIKDKGQLYYLFKPIGTLIPYFITSSEARTRYPGLVIKYLQARIEW